MEEKLQRLYKECVEELKKINIDIECKKLYGKIDIKISKRNVKRYGCCKQENPDKKSAYIRKRKVYYRRYNEHHIEISKWLMELNDEIIKNTIMHELIHCLPDCNNHGKEFKYYAKLIKENLGYNITRLGNKEEDYKKSNLVYETDNKKYKYLVICKKCNQKYFRQRISKNFTRKYVCGKCRGKLEIAEIFINP